MPLEYPEHDLLRNYYECTSVVVSYLLVSNDTRLVLRTLHWRRVRDTPTSSERRSREQTCGRVTQLHWWENVLLAKKLASSDSATGQDLPGTSGSAETPLRAQATRHYSTL